MLGVNPNAGHLANPDESDLVPAHQSHNLRQQHNRECVVMKLGAKARRA